MMILPCLVKDDDDGGKGKKNGEYKKKIITNI